MPEQRPRGPYKKGLKRREEILDRALEVFAERGSSGTSLRAIASEIDIEHSTVRHYFDSLEALKLAVVARSEARTANTLTGEAGSTLMRQLYDSARINVGVPGLIALYTSMLATSVEPNDELARAHFVARFDAARASIAHAIEEGRRTGATPAGPDANALAALVLAAFDGLQVQWLLDPSIDLPDIIALLHPLIGETPAPAVVLGASPEAP